MNPSNVLSSIIILAIVALCATEEKKEKKPIDKLQIGVKKRIPPEECLIKTRKGDALQMLYIGTLHANGDEFDRNQNREDPFKFTLGVGQVISGWDKGLLGMCKGEKRKLMVPADMGYGMNGAPPKIPADAALLFDVELLDIVRNDEL